MMRSPVNKQETPLLQKYYLKPGFIFVSRKPTVISTVLGSCVSVCLRDNAREYGGMNHFLFPQTDNPSLATAQYGNIATNALIRCFFEGGSRAEHLEAQIFGGAQLADGPEEAVEVSRGNVATARAILERNEIRVVSEDVGGNKGRKIVYNNCTNHVMIIHVNTIRKGDWYPYQGRR